MSRIGLAYSATLLATAVFAGVVSATFAGGWTDANESSGVVTAGSGAPLLELGSATDAGVVSVPLSVSGTVPAPYRGFALRISWAGPATSANIQFNQNVFGGAFFCQTPSYPANTLGGACFWNGGATTTATGRLATLTFAYESVGCVSVHIATYGPPDNGTLFGAGAPQHGSYTFTEADGSGPHWNGYGQDRMYALGGGTADADGDTLTNQQEASVGTDPCVRDTDDDGCADSEEIGLNQAVGGQRDPLYFWDFYDVNDNSNIDLSDTLVVLAHFGHSYNSGSYQDATDNLLDRFTPNSAQSWRTAEANDGIDLVDALANLKSFGHNCTAAP
jgi:hypothetical protein